LIVAEQQFEYDVFLSHASADKAAVRELAQRLKGDGLRVWPLIGQELPELAQRDARMQEAAAEDTLCGHLRRAIHRSRRPLKDIAADVGISTTLLCDFSEGERTLRSDVLDRLTHAVGVTVSLMQP
jgi:hypothetical protein